MSEYDETNRGVFFQPHPDQKLVGQGKLNINGTEHRVAIVKEKMSRDGDPVRNVYVRVGILFNNKDRETNEKAPNLSGPLDPMMIPPDYRIAGWIGSKNDKTFCSLLVSEKKAPEQEPDQGNNTPNTSSNKDYDDEIPF